MSLLNRPNIKPTEQFYSDGTYSPQRETIIEQPTVKPDKTEDVVSQIRKDKEKIDSAMNLGLIPEQLINLLKPIITIIDKVVDEHEPKDKEREDNESPTDKVSPSRPYPETEKGDDFIEDEKRDQGEDDYQKTDTEEEEFTLIIPTFSTEIDFGQIDVDVVRKSSMSYSIDMMNLIGLFYQNLRISIFDYIKELLKVSNVSGVKLDKLMGSIKPNTKDVMDGFKTVNDMVLRNEIAFEQNFRFLNKFLSPEELIVHLQQCKTASEFRARYASEKYGKQNDYLDQRKDEITKASVESSIQKYMSAFKNGYKYFNSTVININELLNIDKASIQAKAILFKNNAILRFDEEDKTEVKIPDMVLPEDFGSVGGSLLAPGSISSGSTPGIQEPTGGTATAPVGPVPPGPPKNGKGTLIASDFQLTAYCNCKKCCGKWSGGPTASGAMPKEGITVAVDKKLIPLKTKIYIEGIGERIAQDTGSAINGHIIDVYINNHERAKKFGRKKNVKVYRMD